MMTSIIFKNRIRFRILFYYFCDFHFYFPAYLFIYLFTKWKLRPNGNTQTIWIHRWIHFDNFSVWISIWKASTFVEGFSFRGGRVLRTTAYEHWHTNLVLWMFEVVRVFSNQTNHILWAFSNVLKNFLFAYYTNCNEHYYVQNKHIRLP